MSHMTIVNGHRNSVVPTDANNHLYVEGRGESGGAHTDYLISHDDGPGHMELNFQTLDRPGLTNEVLLAIVANRLSGFQTGQFPCEENAVALSHINCALAALKERTRRRSLTGLEGKMAEDKTEPKPRVYMENTTLFIGALGFRAEALKLWKNWSQVEAAVKRFDPVLTDAELAVIGKAAADAGGGAANGLAELKSALASTRKA